MLYILGKFHAGRTRALALATFTVLLAAPTYAQETATATAQRETPTLTPVDVTAEVLRSVTAVAEELARQGRSYAELDGRFARQVVVRGLAS